MRLIKSTASLRPPEFPGIVGYTPLPHPMTESELANLPNDVLVAEIRHYLTIVEQKKQWEHKRRQTLQLIKGSNNACTKSQQPPR